jgi:K+ potassium transporter integral membrane domain
MALGATYHPNVLAKLGVVGMGADVEKARSWYRKAESHAQRKQHGGSTLLQIVSSVSGAQPPPIGERTKARISSDVGSSIPSILALLRLTTRSNLTARSIGRSAGGVPFRTSSSLSNASPSNSNIIRMNELVPPAWWISLPAIPSPPKTRTSLLAVSTATTLGALGIVYGDIGTSSLYAFREAIKAASADGSPSTEAVLGVVSLIIWSLILVVSLKYATLVILVGLFLVQRRGTGFIGGIFGPIMLVWFIVIGILGVCGIVLEPRILAAFNPLYALDFLIHAPLLVALASLAPHSWP